MVKLVLIRHGQTVWNKLGKYQGQADIELSELGVQQAVQLGENYPFEKPAAIFSSDLKRAQDTAREVARHFDMEITPVEGFREIKFGKWEGLTYNEIHEGWPEEHSKLFSQPDSVTCPGGECFAQVRDRAVGQIKSILQQYHDGSVVIVAHGGVIRTILCYALGMPLSNMWRIRQDNTALNLVTVYDENMVVELMNSTNHLEEKNKNKTVDKNL